MCDHCGKPGAKLRHVSRSCGKGASLFVIENVPVISCPACGMSYLTAETLHELERIKLHRQALAVLCPWSSLPKQHACAHPPCCESRRRTVHAVSPKG
ncbi:MAG: YgiT-type zinc finger protein [Chloroflexota bacterium]|nr:YgiT-type zinc finger protein [Chloroflexota bacterium]